MVHAFAKIVYKISTALHIIKRLENLSGACSKNILVEKGSSSIVSISCQTMVTEYLPAAVDLLTCAVLICNVCVEVSSAVGCAHRSLSQQDRSVDLEVWMNRNLAEPVYIIFCILSPMPSTWLYSLGQRTCT